jgi:RNA polymerase sigma factor (TIGR02999 family)
VVFGQSWQELLPLVYEELRVLARQRLANEKPGQTLQATALVHEAYLRLVGNGRDEHWNSRGHFFGAAAEAMRRIVVESARRKKSKKRGGDLERMALGSDLEAISPKLENILIVDEALQRLAGEEPETAELVKLLFFAGLSVTQAAEIRGISRSVAYDQWKYARAWLQCAIENEN